MPRERITAATCRSCGACCWSTQDQEVYCDVTAADVSRLPKRFVRLNVLGQRPVDMLASMLDGRHIPAAAIRTKWAAQRSGPFRNVRACVCAALQGSLMHKVRCSVYKVRPTACRKAIKPGDRSCRWIRSQFRQAADRLQEEA
jgi:hypothetical protein